MITHYINNTISKSNYNFTFAERPFALWSMENSESIAQKKGLKSSRWKSLTNLKWITCSASRMRSSSLHETKKPKIPQMDQQNTELKTNKSTGDSKNKCMGRRYKMCPLAGYLKKEERRILVTPRDGFSLLHSVAMACRHLNPPVILTLQDIKELTKCESRKRIDSYINLLTTSSEQAFCLLVNQFLDEGVYDNDVIDALPYIMANALGIRIKIFNCSCQSFSDINPEATSNFENAREISLVLRNLQYDALVPLASKNPIKFKEMSKVRKIDSTSRFSIIKESDFAPNNIGFRHIWDVESVDPPASNWNWDADSSSGYSTFCGTDEESTSPAASSTTSFNWIRRKSFCGKDLALISGTRQNVNSAQKELFRKSASELLPVKKKFPFDFSLTNQKLPSSKSSFIKFDSLTPEGTSSSKGVYKFEKKRRGLRKTTTEKDGKKEFPEDSGGERLKWSSIQPDLISTSKCRVVFEMSL